MHTRSPSRQVDDAPGCVLGEQGGHALAIGEIQGVVNVSGIGQQLVETGLFQGRVVIRR